MAKKASNLLDSGKKTLDVLCVDASVKMAEQTRKKGFTTIISDLRDLKLDSGKKTLDEIDVETEFLIKLIKGEYRIMCHLNPNISYQCIFYIGRKISYE